MKITKVIVNGAIYLLTEQSTISSKKIREILDYNIGIGGEGLIFLSAPDAYNIDATVYNRFGELKRDYMSAIAPVAVYLKPRLIANSQFAIKINDKKFTYYINQEEVVIKSKIPELTSMIKDYASSRPFLIMNLYNEQAVTIVNDIQRFEIANFGKLINKRFDISATAVAVVNRNLILTRFFESKLSESDYLLEGAISAYQLLRKNKLIDNQVECFSNSGLIKFNFDEKEMLEIRVSAQVIFSAELI